MKTFHMNVGLKIHKTLFYIISTTIPHSESWPLADQNNVKRPLNLCVKCWIALHPKMNLVNASKQEQVPCEWEKRPAPEYRWSRCGAESAYSCTTALRYDHKTESPRGVTWIAAQESLVLSAPTPLSEYWSQILRNLFSF